jgi:hypothetical protein
VDREVYINSPALRITNNTTSTFFFRMRGMLAEAGLADLWLRATLCDVSTPSSFDHGETDMALSDDGATNMVFSDAGTLLETNWYHVWIVVDNTADTFDTYLQREGDSQFQASSAKTFRNGVAANDLVSFMLKVNSNSGQGSNGDAWFDDLYIAHGVDAHTADPLARPSSLAIANATATNIATTAADLVGTLDATQSVVTVTVYWSTNDNADSTAWLADGDAASMAVGTYTNVTGLSVTGSVSSLTGGTTYYYTMAATNAATNLWASPNVGFTTIDPDADGDGMLDAWEIANFGDTTTSDGTGDLDSDGFIDRYEYIAGTQPTNGSSCLRFDGIAAVNAGSYELTWPGVSGKTYDVLYKTNLSDSVWLTNVADVAGSEPLTVTTNSVAGPRAFFILRVK